MYTFYRRVVIVVAALFLLPLVAPVSTYAGNSDERKKEELKKRIEALQQKRNEINRKAIESLEKNKIAGKSLDEVIARWEKLLADCNAGMKSMRCADAMYNLGALYYDKSRDEYIQRREEYEEAMKAYDRNPRGPEPVSPVPDYSKSLKIYEDLVTGYPEFSKISEAYYQMGTIYLLTGDLDRCKKVYQKIVDDFPQSPRASMAYFKLSDLAYLDHDLTVALKYLEKIREDQVDIISWEMVHYRKAECYYNTGDFDKAIDLFYTYTEKCDAGIYKKREFREMALEFMAICFSDMSNGGEEAIKFFKKVGSKSYEPYVMYTIGMKNRTHGQWEDAIKSLQTALKRFPYYKHAPTARQMLIECFVVKKDHEKANVERERLVDDYGPGSAWYKKNQGEKEIIEQARNEVKRAIGSIAIYYHAIAQKKKDKAAYEKALKRYQEFFKEFPDDPWRVYEFKYNIAEIYGALGDCQRSAENYEYVAMQDISKYPEYKFELDTLGMEADDVERMKKKTDKGPVLISQEDAGYNVVVALDNCRKKEMAEKGLNDEQAYSLPITKRLIEFAERFQARFPKSSNAAEVLYIAGNIHYNAKSYDDALRVFKQVTEKYPSSKMGDKSLRMLANCYSSSGQFDMAMTMYRQLISKQKPNTPEQMEVIDLAAGAMYKRAEGMQKGSDLLGAAGAFKAISTEFPTSKIADLGWFEAGVCYENLKDYKRAAETFESLPSKFPKSPMREKAFLRAAENYKTANELEKAAQVYVVAANTITKADFAIPSLSAASECYQKLEKYDMAGKMNEIVFERYANDPKTPIALYNAGLMFEKAKLYSNAISVYSALSKRFPESDYAAEGFFSIGLCYEKMGQFADMAGVFNEYAQKFANVRSKQVQALVKAGKAYFNMGNYSEAEKSYQMASSIYEKFHKTSDIDVGDVAEAYYRLGEVYYKKFSQIKLAAKNEREMKNRVAEKTKALEESAKQFAKAIELGVEEWTIRATFMIGEGFVDMADAVANQTLFGTAEERIGSKIKILSSLEKYYGKAQEYFFKNIEWAHNQNIAGVYIDTSIDKFMEMRFRIGENYYIMGEILKNAPIPKGLSPEEQAAYKELLEEKWLKCLDEALPRYQEVIKAAKDFGIAQNPWLDKTKERIAEIKPDDELLNTQIEQWQPSPKSPSKEPVTTKNQVVNPAAGGPKSEPRRESVQYPVDEQTQREMRRIQNIMNMEISAVEKIQQLKRIEIDAQRNIELEQEKISQLKQQLQ